MCEICVNINLGIRSGIKPKTTPATPHEQLDQIAPLALQERLVSMAANLDGVHLGRSRISGPGTRAFLLDEKRVSLGPRHAFILPGEFAHIHPASDGSLHINLPEAVLAKALQAGWGEIHPAAGQFGTPRTVAMIYGPRNETDFIAVWSLLRISHAFATGTTISV